MARTDKLDLRKKYKDAYSTPKKPTLIDLEPARFLAIDGRGAPGGEAFQDRIGALYSMAFTIKMTRKFAGKQDYGVCPLECVWYLEDGSTDFASAPPDCWCWTLLIRTPDFIDNADLERAVKTLIEKGKSPAVGEVRLETIDEGKCVQMLHVGPYDAEQETVERMESFMEEQGLKRTGRHHEIYISDPRRVEPARLKTILRFAVDRS